MARPVTKKKAAKEEAPKKKSKVEREEKATKKASKKEEKQKGRPVGVIYVVPKKNMEAIEDTFEVIEDAFDTAKALIKTKVKEKGSKSAIKDIRACLQEMIVTGKELRKILQEAKEAIKTAPAPKKASDDDDDDDD